ncbi:MAG: oxaloacetate decarboxylase [Sphingomonadaceae bacterium]|nr:oxaloacetate decarboxylase [Sphingomonadaceae bacterium]
MDRSQFKARILSRAPLLLPGIAHPLAAIVAADIGFEALYVTGAGLANIQLGVPDLGILNLSDMADAVARIAGVVDLPLVVDADTGYGNSLNCYHAVRRLETAGAAVIQIEDQIFPKRCGHFDGKEVVSSREMVSKIKAAVDARRHDTTLIMARTDARATEGIEAAIERAAAYREAGADILFVEALIDEQEMRAVPERIDAPHLINIVVGGKTPELSLSDLGEMGYTLALYANAPLQAAVAGMQKVLGALKQTGSLSSVRSDLVDFAERQRLLRTAEMDALRARFEGEPA